MKFSHRNVSKNPVTPSISASGDGTDSVKKTLEQAKYILEKLRVSIDSKIMYNYNVLYRIFFKGQYNCNLFTDGVEDLCC